MSTTRFIIEALAELGKMLMEALESDDPSKLRKVVDIFPPGHVLRTTAERVYQEELTRRAVANRKP